MELIFVWRIFAKHILMIFEIYVQKISKKSSKKKVKQKFKKYVQKNFWRKITCFFVRPSSETDLMKSERIQREDREMKNNYQVVKMIHSSANAMIYQGL